jgi:hypothetical protein
MRLIYSAFCGFFAVILWMDINMKILILSEGVSDTTYQEMCEANQHYKKV